MHFIYLANAESYHLDMTYCKTMIKLHVVRRVSSYLIL
jgi:hypothetical protein